jgi:hypothetical protein
MPEQLLAEDGKVIPLDPDGVDPEFARAMAAPAGGAAAKPEYPAPPRRDPAAPHGRDSKGEPLAPYGYKADGTPRQVPAGPGKPPGKKTEHAQPTRPQPPAAAAGDVRARRAEDATTTFELLSAGASLLALLGSSRAIATHAAAEKKGDKAKMDAAAGLQERCLVLQLDAAAFAIHADAMGPSIALMADKNRLVAAMADRLALFNGVAGVGIAVMPLIYQLTANHAPKEARDNMPPQLLQLGVLPPGLLMEKLEAQNAVKMARAQSAILAEKQAAEAELAALRGEGPDGSQNGQA